MSTTNLSTKKPKKVNRSKTTKPSDPLTHNLDDVIFDPVVSGTIPGSDLPSWRINIATRLPQTDEEKRKGVKPAESDLVLSLDRSFCFGVSENRDTKTGALNGYSCAIPLWDRDGATPRQLATSKWITAFAEKCKDHLLSNEVMSSVERFNREGLERSDLKKLDPLYWKREKGKIIDGTGPTLYPKLNFNAGKTFKKKQKNKEGKEEEVEVQIASKMFTIFYLEDEVDANGRPVEVDPLEFVGKYFYITPLIRFDSIYIGAKTTLQFKIHEADVKALEGGQNRLLHTSIPRAPTTTVVSVVPSSLPNSSPNSASATATSASAPVEVNFSDDESASDPPEPPKVEDKKVVKVEKPPKRRVKNAPVENS